MVQKIETVRIVVTDDLRTVFEVRRWCSVPKDKDDGGPSWFRLLVTIAVDWRFILAVAVLYRVLLIK